MTAPEESRIREVDELRQQLRSLGYLEAGIDRFVLGPAREARTPAAIAWLASVRIGLMAAVLLGPAAAIGVAARLPGLVTGPRDGFVVAAYLGLLFGVAVCAGSFLVSLLVSRTAARSRHDRPARSRLVAVAAGGVVTAACLAYLTLWWDASAVTTAPSTSFQRVWTIVALALAAAISLLLGHAVTLAALAVTVATSGTGTAPRGVPGASRRAMTVVGALAFCGALLLLNLTTRFDRGSAEAPPLTVVSGGVRIRLIAVDGFDPEIAQRLADSGRIPALAAALNGARALVRLDDTRDPARTWTTIATGQPADIHAVQALETRRVAGLQGAFTTGEPSGLARALAAATDLLQLTRPSIASGDERRVKSFWEVASNAGLRTVVVNWWATWPAPAGSGIVLTDRATLRLEHGGELDAEIAPPETYELLRARWPELRKDAAGRAQLIKGDGTGTDGLLRRSAEVDALQLALVREVSGASVDLSCVYLPGLDLVQHGLLSTAGPGALPPSAISARLSLLEQYYIFLDGLLASVLEPAAEEVVILLTGPGRVQASTSGLIVMRGSIANPRVRDAAARPTDIMPTVLHAAGVPISRELHGRALIELFSARFASRYPVRDVSTYGRPTQVQAPRGGQPLDQEMIDRLRSLGYVR